MKNNFVGPERGEGVRCGGTRVENWASFFQMLGSFGPNTMPIKVFIPSQNTD